MSAPSYLASMIKPVRWAPTVEQPDGSWRAWWRIAFRGRIGVDGPALEAAARRCDDAFFGFSVDLRREGVDRLRATVATTRWSMDDPYYFLTYHMFSRLEMDIGPIATIEGYPRDWWWPFRRSVPISAEQWQQQLLALRSLVPPDVAG